LEALEPFRLQGPKQDPEPLPYLKNTGPASFDIHLEVHLQTQKQTKAVKVQTKTETTQQPKAKATDKPKAAGKRKAQPAKTKAKKPKTATTPKDKVTGKKRKATTTTGESEPKKAKKAVKPPIPESEIKKRVAKKRDVNQRNKLLKKLQKKTRNLRKTALQRARRYEFQYAKEQKDLIRNRRLARNTGRFYVDPEPKVAIVVRIRGILGVSPKVKKILRLLRLRQLHSATFVKISGPMIKMLQLVEPYVAYGYPNLKTIREIVYKRGYASVRGQRLRITDNRIIYKNLKRFNVICMEDVIHEIYTVGRAFKWVNKFLWPFKLRPPRGGFVKKRTHFTEGGDAGNRERYINKLIRKML